MSIQPLELRRFTDGLAPSLEILIGGRIELLASACWDDVWIAADPMTLETAVVALMMQARLDLPDGGTLTLTVSEAQNPGSSATSPDHQRRRHGVLSIVEDEPETDIDGRTSDGMGGVLEGGVLEVGDLGKANLLAAQAIATRLGGFIDVEVQPTKTRAFRLYLPVLAAP